MLTPRYRGPCLDFLSISSDVISTKIHDKRDDFYFFYFYLFFFFFCFFLFVFLFPVFEWSYGVLVYIILNLFDSLEHQVKLVT